MSKQTNSNNDLVSVESHLCRYRDAYIDVLKALSSHNIETIASVFWEAKEMGRTIFLMGNGGSAACASHITVDFLNINRGKSAKPFRVQDLNSNVPVLTALSNDESYEQVFVRQLERYSNPCDVVVALSASGNSPNILRAVEYANAHNVVTVGFVGFDGGRLKKLCRHSVHINTSKGEYGLVEDVFMFLGHLITIYLARLEQK